MTDTRECATLIGHVTRSVSGILRPGCRILEVGEGPTGLAPGLAGALPECTVIALDTSGELRRSCRRDDGRRPKNLEVLTCGIDSANFLPGSMTAVIASHPCGASLLTRLANCLEPGGRLLLVQRHRNQTWFAALLAMLKPRDREALPSELFSTEPAPHPALSVFRKRP